MTFDSSFNKGCVSIRLVFKAMISGTQKWSTGVHNFFYIFVYFMPTDIIIMHLWVGCSDSNYSFQGGQNVFISNLFVSQL